MQYIYAEHLVWSKSSQEPHNQSLHDQQPSCPQSNIEIGLYRFLCKYTFKLVWAKPRNCRGNMKTLGKKTKKTKKNTFFQALEDAVLCVVYQCFGVPPTISKKWV